MGPIRAPTALSLPSFHMLDADRWTDCRHAVAVVIIVSAGSPPRCLTNVVRPVSRSKVRIWQSRTHVGWLLLVSAFDDVFSRPCQTKLLMEEALKFLTGGPWAMKMTRAAGDRKRARRQLGRHQVSSPACAGKELKPVITGR